MHVQALPTMENKQFLKKAFLCTVPSVQATYPSANILMNAVFNSYKGLHDDLYKKFHVLVAVYLLRVLGHNNQLVPRNVMIAHR